MSEHCKRFLALQFLNDHSISHFQVIEESIPLIHKILQCKRDDIIEVAFKFTRYGMHISN